MQPVEYDPTQEIPGAFWYKLNARQGDFYILIDAADRQLINKYGPWHRDLNEYCLDDGREIYGAKRSARGSKKGVKIHFFLLGITDILTGETLKPGYVGNYINHMPWDNRRDNLRLVTIEDAIEARGGRRMRSRPDPENWCIYDNLHDSWFIQLTRKRKKVFYQSFKKANYTLEEIREIRNEKYRELFGLDKNREIFGFNKETPNT